MKFGITLEIDIKAEAKSSLIINTSEGLKAYLAKKKYGSEVLIYTIGLICVKTKPGYEDWYKIRRPKYKEINKFKSLDGSMVEIKGSFSHDIKIDYEEYDKFISGSDKESKELLYSKILTSIKELKLPVKVKNFDKQMFINDLKIYFENEELD